jgi:uncharacterized membrane protein
VQTVSLSTLAQAALVISYPICCHFAVTLNEPQLQLLAVLLLGLGLTFKGLWQSSRISWLIMVSVSAMLLIVFLLGQTRLILYFPPILLPLLLWSMFHRTLREKQVPLVTQIGTAVHGELPPELQAYTRQVTAVWSYLFAAIATFSTLLPLIASEAVWSLFTNFLSWAFIGILFIGEFIYRQYHFRSIDHPNFWQYLLIVVRADIRKLG